MTLSQFPTRISYGIQKYFSLDSARSILLTLRDYSKVCVARKAFQFSKLKLPPEFPEVCMPSSTARCATRYLVVLLCLLSCTFLLAQSTGGRIIGRVADSTGAVLADVIVHLTNEATGVGRDTKTNSSGDYSFIEVPPGNYRAEFELGGFKKNIQRNILLEVNAVVTLNST